MLRTKTEEVQNRYKGLMQHVSTDEDLRNLAAHLYCLIDTDPIQAIVEAKQFRGKGLAKVPAQILRASIFVDAGGQARDRAAVRDGIKNFDSLTRKHPDELILLYNYANGLSSLAQLDPSTVPDWYVSTHAQRRKARRFYYNVATNENAPPELRAQAFINLGNELDRGYRWVEAYDYWVGAFAIS